MIINNQCSNTELTCPIHFIKGTTYHIQFPQQINPKSIMNANFITGIDQNTFGGALLYHIQRKIDASISVQLLVIWGRESNKFYSHAQLIEHGSTFNWNEDKLKRLYNAYNSQYKAYSNIDQGIWLLNDNTRLRIRCESLHRGFEMKIIISEGRHQICPIKPLWANSQ
jgi:hypothetical protein